METHSRAGERSLDNKFTSRFYLSKYQFPYLILIHLVNRYAWLLDPLRQKLAAMALGKRCRTSRNGGKFQMKLT
jgi:hypothetical protein